MTRKFDPYAEEVRGIIVGPMTSPYEFWTRKSPDPFADPPRRIDRGSFENDAEAVEWFRGRYPDHFKVGVEMRVFDQPEKEL